MCKFRLRDEPANLTHYDFYRRMITVPTIHNLAQVPANVAAVSTGFLEIYRQALVSDSLQLTQLTGIGLRKALEFPIKDYAIERHPEQADAIREKPLGKCIDEFVTYYNVRECARRAVWLGNDETHYERRWGDRDITDLKKLVELTLVWLDNAMRTEDYLRGMS